MRELVHETYGWVKNCQDDLRRVVEFEAPAAGVQVTATGAVSVALDGLDGYARMERQGAAGEIRDRISAILRRATEHDQATAQALRDAMGTDPHRFNPVEYSSLYEAGQARRDAEAFLELARTGRPLTVEEMQRLTDLADRHPGDPLFAELVATALGAQGTVDFWYVTANGRDVEPGTSEWEALAGLQTALGTVLGQATQSDSAAMERWEADMIALGGDHIRGDATMPYGFQAMSALMYTGTYEADFLTEYGEALLAFEQRQAEENPAALWARDTYTDLTFLPDDHYPDNRGHDPVIGFLSALSRNPEASTTFFAAPESFDPTRPVDTKDDTQVSAALDRLNGNLAYLASERNWWHTGEARAAHPVLGEALLAAAAGYTPGSSADEALVAGAYRSDQSASVMEQVMHLYGTLDRELLGKQSGMSESLAAMTTMYLPDIDYWLSDEYDSQLAREDNRSIFIPAGQNPIRGDVESVVRYLSVLGGDETAHGILSSAQGVYTLSLLDSNLPESADQLRRGFEALQTGSTVRGILDAARVYEVTGQFEEDVSAAQQGRGTIASWIKTTTGALIGATAGAAGGTLVASGTAAGAGAAATAGAGLILIPIGVAGAGGLVSEYFNQGVDSALGVQENAQDAVDRHRNLTEQELFGLGMSEIGQLTDRYLQLTDVDATEIRNEYDGGYRLGRDWAETIGHQ
jgi:hypothetical protein